MVSLDTQMDVFTSIKYAKKSKFLVVITVSNGLRPKFYVRVKIYVLFLDSNGNTECMVLNTFCAIVVH